MTKAAHRTWSLRNCFIFYAPGKDLVYGRRGAADPPLRTWHGVRRNEEWIGIETVPNLQSFSIPSLLYLHSQKQSNSFSDTYTYIHIYIFPYIPIEKGKISYKKEEELSEKRKQKKKKKA